MAVEVVISFLLGSFVGAFIGAFALALGVMAKRSDGEVPETPISVIRDNVPVLRKV